MNIKNKKLIYKNKQTLNSLLAAISAFFQTLFLQFQIICIFFRASHLVSGRSLLRSLRIVDFTSNGLLAAQSKSKAPIVYVKQITFSVALYFSRMLDSLS